MLEARRLLLGLAPLLFLAGCEAVGEKEAQLEFERLRQHTITPQGDRVYPTFGSDSSSEEALRGVPNTNLSIEQAKSEGWSTGDRLGRWGLPKNSDRRF